MKRSEMLAILDASIVKHMNHMECCSTQEETLSHILGDLEQAGMRLVDSNDGSALSWEPEEGWEKWIEFRDSQDRRRDFVVKDGSLRMRSIAQAFLDGKSFEELASEHNVTTERIRQIVCKARRLYKRGLE